MILLLLNRSIKHKHFGVTNLFASSVCLYNIRPAWATIKLVTPRAPLARVRHKPARVRPMEPESENLYFFSF